MMTATATKTLPPIEACAVLTILRYTKWAKYFLTAYICRNGFQVKIAKNDTLFWLALSPKPKNLESYRCCCLVFTDHFKEMYFSACSTCSTIILPHSTNHIIDLWRCCCHCRC